MLNAQFDFRKLSISLFRNFPQASLTLEDFWLKGTGDFEGDTLVQAGEVTAAVKLFSLFGDKGYDVSQVSLKKTRLHAIVLPDGRVNRSEERRVGKECRYWRDWSSDVCSSDLTSRRHLSRSRISG